MPTSSLMRCALAALLAACAPPGGNDVGAQTLENVYGADDRRDWYEPSGRLSADDDARIHELGQHTVGMFVRDRQIRLTDPSRVLLCGTNVSDYPAGREDGCFTRTLDWNVYSSSDFGEYTTPLCDDERHRLQPSIGRCSGTLVASDLVLTSGHCMDEDDDVETSAFVFNWRYEERPGVGSIDWRRTAAGDIAFWVAQPAPGLATITRDDVYYVVEAHFVYESADRLRPSGSTTTSTVRDYAIVRLDRPVALPRHPAPIRFAQAHPPAGTPLVAAGFGKGLPLKIDDGAALIDSWYCDPAFNPALICNLHDGYSGASGSGLFTHDGTLVAAHRGSATDFVLDELASCYRSKVLPEAVPDSDFPSAAHSVAWAIDDFCRNGFAPDSALCGDAAYRESDPARCAGDTLDSVGEDVCCERACARDADCSGAEWGGRCDSAGHCRRAATCFSGERWERDACGRPVARLPGTEAECAPIGDTCETAQQLEPISQRVPLELVGLRDRSAGGCGGELGAERVFRLELPDAYDVSIALDGAVLDYSLYLRSGGCGSGDEIFCSVSDASMDAHFEGRLEAGTHYIFADTRPSDGRPAPPFESPPQLVLALRRVDTPMPDGGLADGGNAVPAGGGCGCRASGGGGGGPALLLIALALLLRRKRARMRSVGAVCLPLPVPLPSSVFAAADQLRIPTATRPCVGRQGQGQGQGQAPSTVAASRSLSSPRPPDAVPSN